MPLLKFTTKKFQYTSMLVVMVFEICSLFDNTLLESIILMGGATFRHPHFHKNSAHFCKSSSFQSNFKQKINYNENFHFNLIKPITRD